MYRKVIAILSMALCCSAACHAQRLDSSKSKSALDDFVRSITADFDNFRQQTMADFVEFVRNPWKEFEDSPPIPKPDVTPTPPVVIPEEDSEEPVDSNPIIIEDVVEPVTVDPQPEPVEPIEEVPTVEQNYIDFTFFGTKAKVRYNKPHLPSLSTITENSVADAIEALSQTENDNTIIDCLNLRSELHLCDWAYLKMLEAFSKEATENESQAAALLSYLMIQSGYKVRMATDWKKLYMLFASKYFIYDLRGFCIGGDFYYTLDPHPTSLSVCEAAFPNEKSMSLMVTETPRFDMNESEVVKRKSMRYPNVEIGCSVNMNLLDFYSTYPASAHNDNFVSEWALYANTPMDTHVSSMIYPALRQKLEGKSELQAVNMLLNLVQTGFEYEYDDKVWGYDRAFFAEESLYYPYCDCEDRSILLSRLVRDLLGLKCILIYYPGHLACAVQFSSDNINGDYIMLDGKKFIVTDPTYINAFVGMTMPGMDNAKASVALLE